MLPAPPKKHEIDHRTIKLIVGMIAITTAPITCTFAPTAIASVSASYYAGGWSQSFFIGFLFAMAAFFLAYNGESRPEMIWSKVAALAALGVALFPCECEGHPAPVPYIHGLSAAVMFGVIAYLCRVFYERTFRRNYPEAKVRRMIYAGCGVAIALSIVALAVDHFSGEAITRRIPRFVFYGEAIGLIAFGISWLTASRTLPGIANKEERFSPLRADNPPP